MYSTCLFCNEDLATNEVIEHFPIGRRLAFDAAKGRLWVVCRKCERWNLTPIEERWEAIEECERLFTTTRLRVSTANIGLARLREGLELVRIGNALRPEMAAWRYGDQFGRRRRKHLLLSAAGVAAVGGIVILGPATGIIAGGGWGTWQLANALHNAYQNRRVRTRLRLPNSDRVIPVRKRQLEKVAVVRAGEEWALRVPVPRTFLWPAGGDDYWQQVEGEREAHFTGQAALHAASKLLPAINEKGARAAEVQTAVQLIADVGDPALLFQRYASAPPPRARRRTTAERGHVLTSLPKEVRIALEMASHEEEERRALEGELALLEAAWREAEEVAGIADDMFLPESTNVQLERLKASG
jgi:hypothetical protein